MEPQARVQAALLDRFLHSRRGVDVWIGLARGTARGCRLCNCSALLTSCCAAMALVCMGALHI